MRYFKGEELNDITRQVVVFSGNALYWSVVGVLTFVFMMCLSCLVAIPYGIIAYKIHQAMPELLYFLSMN